MNCKPMVVCAAVALALLNAPRAVAAADIETRERAAKKACLLGEVAKGADILADLYVSTNNPTYIYNQGRCFEQNGKNAEAVLRFKEYLRKSKDLAPGEADALRKRIDELEGSGAKLPKAEPAVPAPQAAPVPAATPPPEPATQPQETRPSEALDLTQTSPPPEPPTDIPVYKRWWFWTGVGALVAGGVVTGILLSRKSTPSSPACDVPGAQCVLQ